MFTKMTGRKLRLLAFVATTGMTFSALSCVARTADTVLSGLTFAGNTGALGLLGPVVAPLTSGIDFIGDLFRLLR